MKNQTIRINGDDISFGDAIEMWQNAGVSRYCINYRLRLNLEFQDSYEDFAHIHCEDCMCD